MGGDVDRDDMANVGEAFMEAVDDNRGHPFLKNWMPADSPSEVIVDLLNALDDQASIARDALRQAAVAFRDEANLWRKDAEAHGLPAPSVTIHRLRTLAEQTEAALKTLGGGE